MSLLFDTTKLKEVIKNSISDDIYNKLMEELKQFEFMNSEIFKIKIKEIISEFENSEELKVKLQDLISTYMNNDELKIKTKELISYYTINDFLTPEVIFKIFDYLSSDKQAM